MKHRYLIEFWIEFRSSRTSAKASMMMPRTRFIMRTDIMMKKVTLKTYALQYCNLLSSSLATYIRLSPMPPKLRSPFESVEL